MLYLQCSLFLSAESLKNRWKALLATAEALLHWTKETREKLSGEIADKDSYGVEDHLDSCEVTLWDEYGGPLVAIWTLRVP